MAAPLTSRTTLRKFSDYFNTCLLPEDHPIRTRSPSPDAGKKSKKHLSEEEKMMESAKKKFAKFDTDGNEVIDTQEAKAMAEWVYKSFHPNYDSMPAEEKDKLTQKLMARLDAKKGNNDGTISFDEFAPWFIETAKHVGDFHKKAHAKQKGKK